MKIMIVDDDKDVLTIVRTIFQSENHDVITVDNGVRCLRQIIEGFKGIIILNIMMPIMVGVETIKHMVNGGLLEKNIIIVLTEKKIKDEEFNEIYRYIFNMY
jgi:CheY-like chemotaxis protein